MPTLREIRDQLINAQMKDIQKKLNSMTKFSAVLQKYKENWEFLFELGELGDIDKPLTKKILSNPTHKVTQLLLYIYSMECFIYTDLNIACRRKD